jgi:hypothetical protein
VSGGVRSSRDGGGQVKPTLSGEHVFNLQGFSIPRTSEHKVSRTKSSAIEFWQYDFRLDASYRESRNEEFGSKQQARIQVKRSEGKVHGKNTFP